MSTYKKVVKEFEEKIIKISRVSKTVKGGRRISFSVIAAVGDKKGKIGIGLGKANGVPDAIKKAISNAQKSMVNVSLRDTTIPHVIIGEFNATRVIMKPASEGTGIIAGSAARDILDLVGVHNILTKILGSKNKVNVAKATVQGLMSLRSAEQVAKAREKTVEEIL